MDKWVGLPLFHSWEELPGICILLIEVSKPVSHFKFRCFCIWWPHVSQSSSIIKCKQMTEIKLFTSYSALMSCHHLLLFSINRSGMMISIWCKIIPHSMCTNSKVRIEIILHGREQHKGKLYQWMLQRRWILLQRTGKYTEQFLNNPQIWWGGVTYFI